MELMFYFIVVVITISYESTPTQCRTVIHEGIRAKQETLFETSTLVVIDDAPIADFDIVMDDPSNLTETENTSESVPNANNTELADLPLTSISNNPLMSPGIAYQPDPFSPQKIPWTFFHNLNPARIVRTISHKINKLSSLFNRPYNPNDGVLNLFNRPYNPNDGVINLFNPAYLLQKLGDKSQQLFSNPNAAIFGFGQLGGHDYPFPYRSSLLYNSSIEKFT